MFRRDNEFWTRLTHLPTGLTAICRIFRSPARSMAAARSILAAKLAKRREAPGWREATTGPPIRSYHLAAPRGVGPHARDHATGGRIELPRYTASLYDPDVIDQAILVRRRGVSAAEAGPPPEPFSTIRDRIDAQLQTMADDIFDVRDDEARIP